MKKRTEIFSRVAAATKRLSFAACAGMFVAASYPTAAAAGDLVFGIGGASPRLKVTSMAERKFETVVRQQFDFSCGSAALATLLTFHYGIDTTETDAFKAMWEVGDQDRIRELGFSLLEMKKYLESEGMVADGFQLSLDRIEEIGIPGIALIDVNDYRHFVVLKGISEENVLIGDPSAGVKSITREEFTNHWDGVILFVRSNVSTGKENFNKFADWRLTPTAPHDRAMDLESLQTISINQTRPSFSGFSPGSIVESR